MTDQPKNFWQRVTHFLRKEVWEIDPSSVSAGRSWVVRAIRVGQLVIKGFVEDDLAIHASALTFVALMSLVPMMAVAFALLKGFGFGQEKIVALLKWTESMPAEFQTFIQQVLGIVNTTNFAAMGWIGVGFVVFAAAMVLGSVEMSFNRIWGVTKSRSVFRQVANYVSILVLVPLLIGIGVTLEASLKASAVLVPGAIGLLARNALRLTSFFSTWLAFWFLYSFLPNTRVRQVPALFSSLLGALVWLAWQKAYISLQVGVARYNAIYGTFASVPIFLAWLYTGWVIVLLGAEFAFALQNSSTFQMESAAENASSKSRLILALSVVVHAAEAMTGSRPRFETGAYGREHRVPIRLLNELVRVLVGAGLLAEMADKQGAFVLLKSPESLRVREVVDVIMQEGARPETLGLTKVDPPIEKVLQSLSDGMGKSLGDLTVRDLLQGGMVNG